MLVEKALRVYPLLSKRSCTTFYMLVIHLSIVQPKKWLVKKLLPLIILNTVKTSLFFQFLSKPILNNLILY